MDRPAAWRSVAIDLESERPFRVGNAVIDPISRDGQHPKGRERLQPQTLKVLIALARQRGTVVTRSELIDSCWGGRIVGEDVINRSISMLRDFAERVGGFQIETVPKAGYRLLEARAPKSRRPWMIAGSLFLFAALTLGLYLAERPQSPSSGREMQVRLAGFTGLSRDVAPSLLQSLQDETLAAFADDGSIGITTGPPGKTPKAGGYEIGGSVQPEGTGYKVILRIDNGLSGASLWSRGFDYPAADSSQMARLVALDLANMARCGFGRSITYPKPMPDDTLRLILSGCETDGTIKWELDRSIDYARRVTLASPDFSMGWSGIAGVAVVLRTQKAPAEAAALETEARHSLDTALRLDPRNSEAWALKAYFLPPSDFSGREDALKRAILARPLDCGCEHHAYGLFLNQVGRLKEAEREFQRGVDIMHLNSGLYANLARAQFAVGDFSKVEETLAAGKRVSPDPSEFDLLAAQFAIGTGDYSKAVGMLRNPDLAASQDARLLLQVANALQSGDGAKIARARETLASLTRDPATNDSMHIGLLAALGDADGALAALRRMAVTDPTAAYRSLFDPAFIRAQGDPAYWDTAKNLGLVGYWQKSRQLPDFCRLKSPPSGCSSLQ